MYLKSHNEVLNEREVIEKGAHEKINKTRSWRGQGSEAVV